MYGLPSNYFGVGTCLPMKLPQIRSFDNFRTWQVDGLFWFFLTSNLFHWVPKSTMVYLKMFNDKFYFWLCSVTFLPFMSVTGITRGLMFVDVKINGKTTWAMIDPRVTHNFVVESESRQLGLKLEKDTSHIKVVNLVACSVHGTGKSVTIELGAWTGKTNKMVISMDDF